ncbi:MAG: TetR/AcrR family transcriptional regulator [Gemmatimonadota bacterium]|nr:MAG: TetR/AcrR family transcriptional regulator [Gemmatimonadota bacterium]
MHSREGSRRARIAAAAEAEFAQFGYAGARVQRIADRARVNKQLVFYYFGSKAGLYRAVMEESSNRLLAASADADARATRHLSQELRLAHAVLGENPQLVRLIVYDSWTGGVARELADTITSELCARLSAIVSQGQGVGYFRDDADPDTIARQAVSLILGQLCLDSVAGTPHQEPSGRNPADDICDILLRYLEW